MLKELSLWTAKLKEGMQLAHSFYDAHGSVLPKSIKRIVFVGMGGSGIAGKILQTFLSRSINIPVYVISSSTLPGYVDAQTLAIVMTYSGNTWEALAVLDQLTEKFIPTMVIAHGGTAIEKAAAKNLPYILLPKSLAPRVSLGHYLGFLCGLFDLIGILAGKDTVDQWVKDSEIYVPLFQDKAYFKEFLALCDGHEFFHVWGVTDDSASVAYRAATQFNENSKLQAVYSEFPELAHNLLVGLGQPKNSPLVLFFHTDYLPAHMSAAIQTICEILRERRVILYKPPVLGDTFESQLFIMILWADFASYHLGHARGVDIERVQIIEELKQRQKMKNLK